MRRRNILKIFTTASAAPVCLIKLSYAQPKEIKFLLIRKNQTNKCLPDSLSKKVNRKIDGLPQAVLRHGVIKGELYGVPNHIEIGNLDTRSPVVFGLSKLANTEELAYLDNQNNVSSIPMGLYSASVRTDKSRGWMTVQTAWRIELDTFAGNGFTRTAIQFHYGRDFSWSDGCIILVGGDDNNLMCQEEESHSPSESVDAVRNFYESEAGVVSLPIKVKVL